MTKIFALALTVVAVMCLKAASSSAIHGGDLFTSQDGYTTGGVHYHETSNIERYLYAATGLIFLAAAGYLFKQDHRNNE